MITKVIVERSGEEAIRAFEEMLNALARRDKDSDKLRVSKVFAPVLTDDGNWMLIFDVALDAENSIEFSVVQTGFGGPRFAEN